jgi:hypothetical protein
MFQVPLTVQRRPVDETGFKIYRGSKNGFYILKNQTWGVFIPFKLRGIIIVYIAFVAANCHFYFFNNIRISKNVQPCPLTPTYSYTL